MKNKLTAEQLYQLSRNSTYYALTMLEITLGRELELTPDDMLRLQAKLSVRVQTVLENKVRAIIKEIQIA